MRWELWRPWYERIAEWLELDQGADEDAAKVINEILPTPDFTTLKNLVHSRECIIFGAGPSLDSDLERLERAGYLNKVLVAADGATSAVQKYRGPDIIVTDLDGAVEDQLNSWRQGSWMAVHAHGDNSAQVRKVVPMLNERVVGTVQVEPFGKLFNFGGFTDGDRAAFMAHELGGSKIYLAGMDMGSKIGNYSGQKDIKRKMVKFEICKELLAWLKGMGAPLFNLTGESEIPHIPKVSI